MSEGPQVKLRTEWLGRHLDGRAVISVQTSRPTLQEAVQKSSGRPIKRCFCKGKHIFIELDDNLFVHNHLLMCVKWRRITGQLVLLTTDIWMALYVGPYSICNINGQLLEIIDSEAMEACLQKLGPDVMAEPFAGCTG